MKLYLIAYEKDLFGTWDSPEKAVREHFKSEINRNNVNIHEKPFDIQAKIKKMLDPYSDYPVFIELEAGKKISIDR